MNIREMYELPCLDGRASFYGKALVLVGMVGAKYLRSYDTVVAKVQDGKLIRLWDDWSATTGRHVNSFVKMLLGRTMNKKEWFAVPYTEPEVLL